MLTTGSTKAVHVLSCLCDNACKRSLVICHKSRASCPVGRLLSVPIWPACAKQGRQYDTNKKLPTWASMSLSSVSMLFVSATKQGKFSDSMLKIRLQLVYEVAFPFYVSKY